MISDLPKFVAGFPQAAYVVLATGLVTILTTILTNVFAMHIESKKAARNEAQESRKRQEEWQLKQREIKASKLAELWMATELVKERLNDAEVRLRTGDQILPPASKDLAGSASSIAYGIAILHFPQIRPLIYKFHVETVKYEADLWFQSSADSDAALDRWIKLRTELADSIEAIAREL